MSCKRRSTIEALKCRIVNSVVGDVYFGDDIEEAREMFNNYVKTGKLGDKARTYDGSTSIPPKVSTIFYIGDEVAGYYDP